MEHNHYNLNDEEANLPVDPNGKNVFGLPLDYFASFEDKLKTKIESQEELQEFPLLSSIPKTNLFATPVDYFAAVEQILEIKAELSAHTQLQNVKPFIPAALDVEYTNNLQASINYKIELAEELKAYQKLYAIDKVNPFLASDAYFESIAERVKDRIYSVKQIKVSVTESILNIVFGKKTAFAFGIVFIVSLSLYFYRSSGQPLEIGDCKTLACLERQEILNNNKVISNFDEDQLIDLVDVNTLNEQLNSSTKNTNTTTHQINIDSIGDDDLLDEL